MRSQKSLASILISCAALVSHSAFAADLEADMKT
ncbi:cytochrome B, partial [Agrobacterium tumefaciens]|nr:cytochrome B [Agrobacterium tumefaciens]